MVVPTSFARHDDWLLLHGSVASRSLRSAREPVRACVTVTHVDGLVLARSVFEHAVNYRCAMVYGTPEVLTDPGQKLVGLRAISDQAAPGQWEYVRSPSDRELAATTVLRMALDECSVKIRARARPTTVTAPMPPSTSGPVRSRCGPSASIPSPIPPCGRASSSPITSPGGDRPPGRFRGGDLEAG